MEFSIDDSLAAWNGVDNAKHVSPSSIPTNEIQVLMHNGILHLYYMYTHKYNYLVLEN